MARDNFDDELELHRVDCAGSNGLFDNYDYVVEKRREFEAAKTPLLPPRFINGGDLIARGMEAGPAFGEILTEAQDLQLEGTLTSRDEALAWLEEKLSGYQE
jgi:poly(A) polymerase